MPGWAVGIWRSPAALAAAGVNLLPLFGVLALGWGISLVVVLYWLENLVVGAVNVFKMAATGAAKGPGGLASLILFVPFFIIHYGGFCFVHGLFVVMLFGGALSPEMAAAPDIGGIVRHAMTLAPALGAVLAAIAAWRLWSFWWFFLRRGDFRAGDPGTQMIAPYGRIVLLHFAIFAGAFGAMWAGDPMWGVALLVLGKALFDAWLEWRTEQGPPTQTAPQPVE
jgi:hypothetical protein